MVRKHRKRHFVGNTMVVTTVVFGPWWYKRERERERSIQLKATTTTMIRSILQPPRWSLNLATADAICNAALDAAQHLQTPRPVCITVVDARGDVVVQKRMDACPPGAYVEFSMAKARTCIHLQTSSRAVRLKYTSGATPTAPATPAQFTQAATMATVLPGQILPVAGGVLLQATTVPSMFEENKDDQPQQQPVILGAVGVSGAAADEDEYMAWYGIHHTLQSFIGSSQDNPLVTTVPSHHSCTTLKPQFNATTETN